MKLNSAVSKFITNKWVLNIVAFLALFNVIGYMVIGNFNAVLYFVVFAVLVRYFSKNMTIVLGIPLIITNLLVLRGNTIEGMENNGTSQSNIKGALQSASSTSTTNSGDQQKIDELVKKNKDTKSAQGLQMHNIDNAEHDTSNMATQSTGGDQQGFEPGRKKNRGYEIDYATTIEDAYDQLNNILGSDGVQRLTSDTQNLMKQQMQLAEAMKNMQPMVESIAPMVKNLQGMMGQMGDGKEGLNGLMDLAKKFSGQAAPVEQAKK
jgi:hypothetical protein